MRTFEDYERVLRLHEQGFNKLEISQQTDLPYSSIRKWIKRFGSLEGLNERQQQKYDWHTNLTDNDYRKQYAYLFGLYLGDGHIVYNSRSHRLAIVLDTRYPNIVKLCQEAMVAVMPNNKVNIRFRNEGRCCNIYVTSNTLPEMFPQHGKGAKHLRKIALEEWQHEIVDEFPEAFLRGLYHSDGTYIEPVINGKIYPRYEFINFSDDILKMFCDTLNKLGVHWTIYNRRVTIARRKDVAILDRILGPKS